MQTAKGTKISNLYRQWESINAIIEELDGEGYFIIQSVLFPEVIEVFKKLGWSITRLDDSPLPSYLFDCSDITLTDEEITKAFTIKIPLCEQT